MSNGMLAAKEPKPWKNMGSVCTPQQQQQKRFLFPNNVKTHLLVKKALLAGLIPWPIILTATLLLL
jgi:hypothetical protein